MRDASRSTSPKTRDADPAGEFVVWIVIYAAFMATLLAFGTLGLGLSSGG